MEFLIRILKKEMQEWSHSVTATSLPELHTGKDKTYYWIRRATYQYSPPGYALQPRFKIIGKEIQEQPGNNTDSKSTAKHSLYKSNAIILYYHFCFWIYRLVKIEIYAAFTRIHLLYFQGQMFHCYVLIKIHLCGVASKQLYCTGVNAT
jgi:hypothetical protein